MKSTIMTKKTMYHVELGKIFVNDYLSLNAQNHCRVDPRKACKDKQAVADFNDYLRFCRGCLFKEMTAEWLQKELEIAFNV